MQRLTRLSFKVLEEPGAMRTRTAIEDDEGVIALPFGVRKKVFPRFAVTDPEARVLGSWLDGKVCSFAMKEIDGWRSVDVGGAPLPVEVLKAARARGREIILERSSGRRHRHP